MFIAPLFFAAWFTVIVWFAGIIILEYVVMPYFVEQGIIGRMLMPEYRKRQLANIFHKELNKLQKMRNKYLKFYC